MRVQIDSTGTMTIPRAIRDNLGLSAGGEVELRLDEEGRAYIERAEPRPEPEPQTRPDGLDRIRGTMNIGMTTDEMMRFLRGDDEE